MFVKSGREETTYLEGEKIPSIRYHILKGSGFVKDGFSTRRGGVSKGQFSSMNFSVKMGDNEENVQENFRIFLAEHGFKNPVMADQVHGKTIRLVSREDVGKNVFLPKDYSGVDGLITNEPGVTLVTTFADCVPLYLVDPVNHAIGLAHSGWRGTIQRIGAETLGKMKEPYGTNPGDVLAAIGPSICVNCYEVSKELAEEFALEFQTQIQPALMDRIPEQDTENIVWLRGDKYYLNLWAANYKVLADAGIKQIALPDLCTCENSQELFSHRASKGKRGNLCAFLMIEE